MPAHIRIKVVAVTVRAVRVSNGARDWAREVSGQADHLQRSGDRGRVRRRSARRAPMSEISSARCPKGLKGRQVVHFIDNQGALANCISSSSKDLDCAWVVTSWRWCAPTRVAPCGSSTFARRRISFLPSRSDFELLRTLGSTWIPPVLPSARGWVAVDDSSALMIE